MGIFIIAIFVIFLGYLFICLGKSSGEKAKEIKKFLENNKNLVETEGTLEFIKIEGGKNSRSFDIRLKFKNQNGKTFVYDETHSSLNSKASFLWKCENKGEQKMMTCRKSWSYWPSVSTIKEIQMNIMLKN